MSVSAAQNAFSGRGSLGCFVQVPADTLDLLHKNQCFPGVKFNNELACCLPQTFYSRSPERSLRSSDHSAFLFFWHSPHKLLSTSDENESCVWYVKSRVEDVVLMLAFCSLKAFRYGRSFYHQSMDVVDCVAWVCVGRSP